MKKNFNLKSSYHENLILKKVLNFIEKKIHNSVVKVLLMIAVTLSMTGLGIGFFVMPFITYSPMALKIIFSVLWVISCIVFVFDTIGHFKQEEKDDKWRGIIMSACFIIFFGLCLVNNNYYHFGDWWQIAIVVAMGLYTVMMIYEFVIELIRDPKGTLSSLLMGAMFLFGFLCILASSLTSIEMSLRKEILLIGTICIAIPIIAMLIAKILKISKAEKVLEYCSLIILCVFLLIGISYVISFINPNIDAYQTFVTLLASFIGGGLTLLGVGWTIRKTDMDRKEEELKKHKPFFIAVNYISNSNIITNHSMTINDSIFVSDVNSNDKKIKASFKNKGLCGFFITAIKLNDVVWQLNNKFFIDKDTLFNVHLEHIRLKDEKISKVSFICEDLLENKYNAPLKVRNYDGSQIHIESIGKIELWGE